MKAVFENIETLKGDKSFVAYSFTVPYFEFKWHYHPEYELTLITEGNGKRIVGDNHENFVAGDLVLLGSGLPHTWSSEHFNNNVSSAIVIQFSEAFINTFTQFSECYDIRQLLANAHRGLFFNSKNTNEIQQLIKLLPEKDEVYRITLLLEILHRLASEKQIPLSSEFYTAIKGKENQNRINKVCQFVQDHSAEKISVEHVAEMIHLSKSAFCKFFKRVMKTNFSDYVNEIRIANACYYLSETDKTVREIAFDTGFESITYFNRVFIKKKSITPSAFRKNMDG